MDPKNARRKLAANQEKVFDALPKKNINQSWKFKDALLPTVEKLLLALSMVIGLALAPTPSQATGDIPDDMKPVAAATRIFALREHLHGDIGVFDADEGHISRGKVNNGEDYEVNHAPGQKCTFTMKRRDGPILFSINFNRLFRANIGLLGETSIPCLTLPGYREPFVTINQKNAGTD